MNADHGALAAELKHARNVLFDFDGPIADLFKDHPPDDLARAISDLLSNAGLLPERLHASLDPHAILRMAAETRPDRSLLPAALVEAERLVTEAEKEAVGTASPTPFADKLVPELVSVGKRIAVASNNSPDAVRLYLAKHGLDSWFGDAIFGRASDPALMKPHPDCLVRAIEAMEAQPGETLLIGDSESDLRAAGLGGVSFCGYAPNEPKLQELRRAGARLVVTDLSEVLGTVNASS